MNVQTVVPNLYEIEMEQGLLGAVIAHNRLFWSVSEMVASADFYDPLHQVLWECISRKIGDDSPADVRSLVAAMRPYLERVKVDEKFDAAEYIRGLAIASSAAPNVKSMAKVVGDLARRRRIVDEASAAIDAAYYDRDVTPDLIADKASEALYDASRGQEIGAGPESLGDVVWRAAKQAEEACKAPTTAVISTGMPSVDSALGGIFPRKLHILAAPPSVGKTGLACQMGLEAAAAGNVVLMFSLEMSAEEIGLRFMATQAGVPASQFEEGRAKAKDVERLAAVAGNFKDSRFFIDAAPKLSMAQMRSRAQAVKRRQGRLDLVIIDHMRLVRAADPRAPEHERLGQVTQDGKAMAKDLGPAVMILTPMNRELWKRESKRPLISDIFGASAVESDADLIWFLYREEYFLEKDQPDPSIGEAHTKWLTKMEAAKGRAEIFSAKRRGGALGSATVRFNGPLVQFTEMAEPQPQTNLEGFL